ncbi:hypothetical protein ID866_6298 [Astraeus odoratus]|nr:hypothetical protein ID866_6298 [Astraeus odoratus]
MTHTYTLQYIQLHVRRSNRAAVELYRNALGYTTYEVQHKYCECALFYDVVLSIYRVIWNGRGPVLFLLGSCIIEFSKYWDSLQMLTARMRCRCDCGLMGTQPHHVDGMFS